LGGESGDVVDQRIEPVPVKASRAVDEQRRADFYDDAAVP
jgi:hypothetical protein